jgi:hypothetical protein
MSFRLEWHYNPNESGSVDATAATSFDPSKTWTVYKEGNRWFVRLGKKKIVHPSTNEPRDFGSLHGAKEGAERLDERLALKRQEAASANDTEAAAGP